MLSPAKKKNYALLNLSSIKPTTDGKMYFCSTYLMRKKYFDWKVLKFFLRAQWKSQVPPPDKKMVVALPLLFHRLNLVFSSWKYGCSLQFRHQLSPLSSFFAYVYLYGIFFFFIFYFVKFLLFPFLDFSRFFSSPGHRPCELLSWLGIRPLAFHI